MPATPDVAQRLRIAASIRSFWARISEGAWLYMRSATVAGRNRASAWRPSG